VQGSPPISCIPLRGFLRSDCGEWRPYDMHSSQATLDSSAVIAAVKEFIAIDRFLRVNDPDVQERTYYQITAQYSDLPATPDMWDRVSLSNASDQSSFEALRAARRPLPPRIDREPSW